MRRAHSEVTDPQEIAKILDSTNIGCLATIDNNGYPYITPVNFVYYQGRIYFHCALTGEKLDNIKSCPKVCFEVDVPLAYLEVAFNDQKSPCATHQLFHCVIIRGTAAVVEAPDLKAAALNALVAKHEKHDNFKPVTPETPEFKACHVVEVTPENMTAKSDLLQNRSEDRRRLMAEKLVQRGHAHDLIAVKAMGFDPQNM
ncbi:MAG: pyridoxamine 5'-phosphate oxidase family protein [Deltaproteobacteria bacterium]|nr:pyridoxamine 5'-phosphate oxidase family protein [Deltaproteobacteria bacterium]